jgi:hypothetical protein
MAEMGDTLQTCKRGKVMTSLLRKSYSFSPSCFLHLQRCYERLNEIRTVCVLPWTCSVRGLCDSFYRRETVTPSVKQQTCSLSHFRPLRLSQTVRYRHTYHAHCWSTFCAILSIIILCYEFHWMLTDLHIYQSFPNCGARPPGGAVGSVGRR